MTRVNHLDDLFDESRNLKPYKDTIQNNLFLDIEACTIDYASAARNGKQNRSVWQPIVELTMKGETFFIVDRTVVKSLLTGLVRSSMGNRAFMAIYKGMPLKETLDYWMTLEDSSKTLTGRFRKLTSGHKIITKINTKDIQETNDLSPIVDLLENLGYTSRIYNYDDDIVKLVATSQYSDEIEMVVLSDSNTYINGKYNVMQTQHTKDGVSVRHRPESYYSHDSHLVSPLYFIQPTLAKNLDFEDTFKVERVIRDLHKGIEETRQWCPVVVECDFTDRLYSVLLGHVKHSYHLREMRRDDRNRLMHEMFLDVRRAFKKN